MTISREDVEAVIPPGDNRDTAITTVLNLATKLQERGSEVRLPKQRNVMLDDGWNAVITSGWFVDGVEISILFCTDGRVVIGEYPGLKLRRRTFKPRGTKTWNRLLDHIQVLVEANKEFEKRLLGSVKYEVHLDELTRKWGNGIPSSPGVPVVRCDHMGFHVRGFTTTDEDLITDIILALNKSRSRFPRQA